MWPYRNRKTNFQWLKTLSGQLAWFNNCVPAFAFYRSAQTTMLRLASPTTAAAGACVRYGDLYTTGVLAAAMQRGHTLQSTPYTLTCSRNRQLHLVNATDECMFKQIYKQEHSESANLCQRQNFNQKSSGIPIRIAGLIRIRICPKTLWMHYLVGVSHFAKYGTNRPLIV